MTEIDSRVPNLPSSARIGQGTVVEQTRAAAEVAAAVQVAQQCPRDVQRARRDMLSSCSQKFVADRAFYRFPRGGTSVTGPTIHLARELARVFGNVQYGIVELRRDDEFGQSEMLAFAWDVETNTRNSNTFIVPHLRDKKGGPERLYDARDIYENNTNMGARRVREAIYAILPPWFTEEAKQTCHKTLADGGGAPLEHRISRAIESFKALGVARDQLEQKLGYATGRWDFQDLAQLGIILGSLERREARVEDEFPPQRVTAAEISGQAPPATETPVSYSPDEIAEMS